MAELNLFHFRPQSTPLHRLDPRIKPLIVLLTVFTAIGGGTLQLGGLSFYLVLLLRAGRVRIWKFARELQVFALLALLIFLPHALRGETHAGGEAAWRFLTVVTAGLLFTAITPPRELHGTAQWLLRPVPGIREGAVATHISLSLLFIPLLIDPFTEVRDARKARFSQGIRNPLVRIRGLAAPLLEKLFQQIDEVSCALESRCYREDAVRIEFAPARRSLSQALILTGPFILIWGVARLLG